MGPKCDISDVINLTGVKANILTTLLSFTESLNSYDLKSIRVSLVKGALVLLEIGADDRWLRFNNVEAAQMFLAMLELSKRRDDLLICNQIDRLSEAPMIYRHGFTCRHQFQVAFATTFIEARREMLLNERKSLAQDFIDDLVKACEDNDKQKISILRESLVSLIDLELSFQDIPVSINSAKRKLSSSQRKLIELNEYEEFREVEEKILSSR